MKVPLLPKNVSKRSQHCIHFRKSRVPKPVAFGVILSLLCFHWRDSFGQVVTVTIQPNDTLKTIADRKKVSVQQLRENNAEFLRIQGMENIGPNEKLSAYLDGEPGELQIKVPPQPANWITHSTSLEGDTLASIADSYGIRLDELKAANSNLSIGKNKVSDYDKDQPLPASQLIEIPPGGKIDESNRPPLYKAIKSAKAGGFIVTQIAPGDKLDTVTSDLNSSGISIDSETLASQNNIANTNGTLRTGQFVAASLDGNSRVLWAKLAVITRPTQTHKLPWSNSPGLDALPVNSTVYVTAESDPFCNVLYKAGGQYCTGWVANNAMRYTGQRANIAGTLADMNKRAPDITSGSFPVSRPMQGGDGGEGGGDMSVVRQARRFLGVPYVWGGTKPSGTDCSGLVLQSFRLVGKKRLPRVSRDQYRVGRPVGVNELKSGDRLYFSASGRRVDHTGLYAGNGRIIEANGGFHKVIERNLFKSSMYKRMYVGARRGNEG